MPDFFADAGMRERAAALRAEWRDEEQQWTGTALERWEHGRALRDIALECMHRGDVVSVLTGPVAIAGHVVGVGSNTIRLEDPQGVIDVSLEELASVALRVGPAPRGDGVPGVADSTTFRSRMLEHELGDVAQVGVATLDAALVGALRVGVDHVRVRAHDGVETLVPMRSVAWVCSGDRSMLSGR